MYLRIYTCILKQLSPLIVVSITSAFEIVVDLRDLFPQDLHGLRDVVDGVPGEGPRPPGAGGEEDAADDAAVEAQDEGGRGRVLQGGRPLLQERRRGRGQGDDAQGLRVLRQEEGLAQRR